MEDELLLKSLNENSKECVIQNRRKGPDFLLTIVNIFNFCIWAMLLIVMSICDNAGFSFFNYKNISMETMNLNFVNIALKFTAALFVVSFVLMFLSFKRCRRRTDKIKTSIFVGEIFSFVIWMCLVFKIYF